MTTHPSDPSEADANARHLFERLVFFSDAVFAIAITLLVLDLKLPADAHGGLSIEGLGSKLFGFGLSFFVIGLYWLNHHQLFGGLAREDGALRVVNLVFLAGIVFLPFPTSVIAEHSPTSVSVTLYAGAVAAVGVMQTGLIVIARRPALMRTGWTERGTRRWVLKSIVPPFVFLASIPVAWRNPTAGMLTWWLIAPINLAVGQLEDWVATRGGKPKEGTTPLSAATPPPP